MFGTMRTLHHRGPESRGVVVDADGAVIGPACTLVRRTTSGYHVVPRQVARAIQDYLLPAGSERDWLFDQCCRIARALGNGELAIAQILGLRIPVDELDGARLDRLSAVGTLIKANFNPDEPRIPAGEPGGGEWTDDGGGEADVSVSGSSGPRRGEAPPSAGGGDGSSTEAPPGIPARPPETTQEKNSFVRRSAEWLRWSAAVAASTIPDARARAFLRALEATAWVVEYLPEILAYLDGPKTLEELEIAVDDPQPGYQIHHVVETQYDSARDDSNANRFRDRLEEPDNLVRIPRWKHVEISSWYSRNNEAYGGSTPRQFLRGKSWDEQYQFGLSALRRFGVLK